MSDSEERDSAEKPAGAPRRSERVEPIDGGAVAWPISSEDDIGMELDAMALAGVAVSFYAADLEAPALGRIVAVDPEEPFFTIEIFGQPPVGAPLCVAMLRGAKIQFQLSAPLDLAQAPAMGKPGVATCGFPASCLMLNRRSAPRVETPLGANYSASFSVGERQLELPLHDFSLGGIGMRASPRQAAGLYVGKKLERVRIELGKDAIIVVDLEVRLSRRFHSFLLGDQVQIGCQFKNLFPSVIDEVARILREVGGEGAGMPRER